MIRNMQIRSKLIAVLVIPLVGLTALAAIGIGASVARGVQADRVNDQAVFAVSLVVGLPPGSLRWEAPCRARSPLP